MQFSWLSNITASFSNVTVVLLNLYDVAHQVVLDSYNQSASTTLSATYEQLSSLSLRSLYSQLVSSSAEALEHIIYACLVYLLVCLGVYLAGSAEEATPATATGTLTTRRRRRNVRLPQSTMGGRVLFVTAHPDDECMFFGPLIYTLTKCHTECQVFLLCLSNGNFENKGQLRREELWRSCEQLGVPSSNIILVNATNLPDDPNVEWKTEAVANLILNTAESLDIQAIVSFDRDGVSQHPNHCAVYYAVSSLCLANLLPKDCKFYALDSVNILRKYLSVFDTLCTLCMSTHWCILNMKQASVVRSAMMEHKSQMKWFRWLYIYFSRYMFINSMREVTLSDAELEMQIHKSTHCRCAFHLLADFKTFLQGVLFTLLRKNKEKKQKQIHAELPSSNMTKF